MLVTDPGDVNPTFLPGKSMIECSADPFLAIHRMSATLSAPPPMIFSGTPLLIASIAAGSATSPNGKSPANVLRTDVPPPCDVRIPVISTPFFLKNPFAIATAYGAP